MPQCYLVSEIAVECDNFGRQISSDISVCGVFTTDKLANDAVLTWHERDYIPAGAGDFDSYKLSKPEGLLHLVACVARKSWEVSVEMIEMNTEFSMSLLDPSIPEADTSAVETAPRQNVKALKRRRSENRVGTPSTAEGKTTAGKKTGTIPTTSAPTNTPARSVASPADGQKVRRPRGRPRKYPLVVPADSLTAATDAITPITPTIATTASVAVNAAAVSPARNESGAPGGPIKKDKRGGDHRSPAFYAKVAAATKTGVTTTRPSSSPSISTSRVNSSTTATTTPSSLVRIAPRPTAVSSTTSTPMAGNGVNHFSSGGQQQQHAQQQGPSSSGHNGMTQFIQSGVSLTPTTGQTAGAGFGKMLNPMPGSVPSGTASTDSVLSTTGTMQHRQYQHNQHQQGEYTTRSPLQQQQLKRPLDNRGPATSQQQLHPFQNHLGENQHRLNHQGQNNQQRDKVGKSASTSDTEMDERERKRKQRVEKELRQLQGWKDHGTVSS